MVLNLVLNTYDDPTFTSFTDYHSLSFPLCTKIQAQLLSHDPVTFWALGPSRDCSTPHS